MCIRDSVLIVGSGHAARDYLKTINEERWLGYQCCGCVSDSPLEGAKLLGGYDRLLDILEEKSYDEVVCALDSDGVSQLSNIVEAVSYTHLINYIVLRRSAENCYTLFNERFISFQEFFFDRASFFHNITRIKRIF